MKKRFLNKKVAAIGLAIGLAAGLGGAAFAYFTSTGAGNGTASVGTTGANIAVEGTSSLVPLTPGGASATITFKAYNYALYNQEITNIHVTGVQACSVPFGTVSTTTYGSATAAPSCADAGALATTDSSCATGGVSTGTATWFTLPDVAVPVPPGDGDLAAATGSGPSVKTLTETGTASMNDLNVNQNACEGLFLNFTFSTS